MTYLRLRCFATVALATALLGGCATTVDTMPSIPPGPPPATAMMPSLPAYQIQLGDVLDVKLFLNPELNETVTVRPDGLISTAVAEDVPAYGRTASQISAELRQSYGHVLQKPQISVVVRSFAPNRVYVAGEVNNPGEMLTVGPNLTVLQAVARAGGVKLGAAREGIFILRRGEGDVPSAYRVNYMDAISGRDPSADVRLGQYDLVYVPRTGIYEAYSYWNQYFQQFTPLNWQVNYGLASTVKLQ